MEDEQARTMKVLQLAVQMEVDGKEFEYDKVYITPRWALL